jgi:hypothetical protein
MSEQTIAQLQEEHAESGRLYAAALDRYRRTGAAVVREQLLDLAAKHPGLTSFSFESESVYNDEGGYFNTVDVSATVDDSVEGQEAAYDEHGDPTDDANDTIERDADVIAYLCGTDADSISHALTVDQIRELSFERVTA